MLDIKWTQAGIIQLLMYKFLDLEVVEQEQALVLAATLKATWS